MSKYFGKMMVATIKRSPMEETPVTCFEHEIPLLEEIHGQGTVKVQSVPEGTVPESVIGMKELDPEKEYDRLQVRHGMHPDFAMSVADFVFNRQIDNLKTKLYTEDQLDELGEYARPSSEAAPATDGDSAEEYKFDPSRLQPEFQQQLQAMQNKLEQASKQNEMLQEENRILKQQAKSEQPAPLDANQNGNITIPELKEKLDALEVEYPSNAKKDDLMQALRTEMVERLEILEAEDFNPDEPLEVLWNKLQEIERPMATTPSNAS